MGRKRKEDTPITKIRDGTVVCLFDKTEEPQDDNDVYCPHFWELKYANGCKYDCQWCYLNGTYRYNAWGKNPRLKDHSKIKADVKQALLEIKKPVLFNAGEVADAQVFPNELIQDIIPLFNNEYHNPYKHKILLLTKDDTRKVINAVTNTANVIFAYSLNAKHVSEQYELKAPHPWDRIEAAKDAYSKGFEVRLRIDPMVPIRRWDIAYTELIDRIMLRIPHASVITLGSPRGLHSTITAGKKLQNDMTWTYHLTDKTNWGLRVPQEMRVNMFKFAIDTLKQDNYTGQIALCKEPLKVWKECGLDPKKTKCNCMLHGEDNDRRTDEDKGNSRENTE